MSSPAVRPPGQVTVRSARTGEYGDAAGLLAEAFVDDPALGAVVRADPDPAGRLTKLFTLQIQETFEPAGAVDVALGRDGALLGAALWARPGGWHTSWWEGIRGLPRAARALGRNLPAAVRSEAACMRRHPTFPHWYLFVVGTSGAARGVGVGSALMRRGLERAAGDGAPVYLEATTPSSAALYARLGFVEMGPVPNPFGPDAVGMWLPAPRPS